MPRKPIFELDHAALLKQTRSMCTKSRRAAKKREAKRQASLRDYEARVRVTANATGERRCGQRG